jgi:hypothetical protein
MDRCGKPESLWQQIQQGSGNQHPAAKAPRIPMFFLRLAAKTPPNSVEKQVTTAKMTATRFIRILCLDGCLPNISVLSEQNKLAGFYTAGDLCASFVLDMNCGGDSARKFTIALQVSKSSKIFSHEFGQKTFHIIRTLLCKP